MLPLNERDVNSHSRHTPTPSKHTSSRSNLSASSKTGENSPSLTRPLAKNAAQRSGRLLTPQSSATKTTSSTPTVSLTEGDSISQLPRRGPSPSLATPVRTNKTWANRVVRRVASAEKAATQTLTSLKPLPLAIKHTMPQFQGTHQAKSPYVDKPLPRRPIAAVEPSLSPTKDSRSLVDASEKPLQILLQTGRGEWPMLTSRAVSAPERSSIISMKSVRDTPSLVPNVDTMVSNRSMRQSRASAHSQPLSETSVVSAKESTAQRQRSDSHDSPTNSVPHNSRVRRGCDSESRNSTQGSTLGTGCTIAFPAQYHSLGNCTSQSHLETPQTVLSEIAADLNDDNANIVTSRTHSPSPASFSRPRRGSGCYISRLPSLPTSPASTASTPARHQRTASRIPIPDSKKATLVDIKTLDVSPGTAMAAEKAPSFGVRRLVSPNALAILDQGTKKRLQRANTDRSTTSTASSSTRIPNLDDKHDEFCHIQAESPEGTSGSSTSDQDEASGPLSKQRHRYNPEYSPGPTGSFDIDSPKLRRAPPSTSHFTGPLPTIHSQPLLPVHADAVIQAEDQALPKLSELSRIARRLSECRSSQLVNVVDAYDMEVTIPKATSTAFKDLISEAKNGDILSRESGEHVPEDDTKNHLSSTLSILEGQSSPPTAEIDNVRLQEMFGHMSQGARNASKPNIVAVDAAAAEMFLAGEETLIAEPQSVVETAKRRTDNHVASLFTPVTSKWSDSSPSAQGTSTELSHKDPTSSIGYLSTSRGPSPAVSTFAIDPIPLQLTSDHLRHEASPTPLLAKHVALDKTQGSVKRARESISEGGGFARMTASSASKRNAKRSSITRSIRKPDDTVRGREKSKDAPMGETVSAHGNPKVTLRSFLEAESSTHSFPHPRSRSKSRTVLDRINGFFAHKRERKVNYSPPGVLRIQHDNKATRYHPQIESTRNTSTSLCWRTCAPPLSSLPVIPQLPRIGGTRTSSRATNASDKSMPKSLPLDDNLDGGVKTLTEKLVDRARLESSTKRRERLLNFAVVLNDAMINVREAHISAEAARNMAVQAQNSYQKTQRAVEVVQRLASSLISSGVRH